MSGTTEHFSDGGGYEQLAGYSRAVRRGRRIFVSGTTAGYDRGEQSLGDTAEQTRRAFTRAIAAVEALGGSIDDVVRTRVMLTPNADWEAACTVHGELFGDVRPANTLVVVHALIGPELLVEVEVDAVTPGEGEAGETS